MHVFRHHDEDVQLKTAFAAVSIDRLQEQACVVLTTKSRRRCQVPKVTK